MKLKCYLTRDAFEFFFLRAKKLLEALKKEESLSWNSHGILALSGVQQPGMNIINLLKIANYKVASVKNGSQYYDLLKKLNLLHFIINKNLLADQDQIENQNSFPW